MYLLVIGNYGKSFVHDKIYFTDLSGITIEFFDVNGSSLGKYNLDYGGTLNIVEDAWTFLVRRNDSPVGVLVTFSEQ